MMKRIVTLMLALLMLLAILPVQAEEMPAELYRIVLRTEDGDVTLGSGVLFGTDRTLLTSSSCWAEGDMYAIGADGEHMIGYRGDVMGTQLITLGLATPSTAQPVSVTGGDYLLDYMLYGVKADGSFVTMDVRGSRKTLIGDRKEVLLYAAEGLLPGAVMYGDDNGVACVTVFQHGEGEGVYAAVADVTLQSIFGAGGSTAGAKVLTNITAECRDGLIHVDWSHCGGYVMNENTVFTAYIAITGNNYLTYDYKEDGETTATFPAVPESEVMVWVVVSESKEDAADVYPEAGNEVAFVNVPAAQPITLYGLKNVRMGLTSGEPGADVVATDFLPQQPLTREALADRSTPIFFQTEDTYAVEAEDDEHTLMVILYTPEGYSHYYFSGYAFMPDYCESDLWVSDVSEIFADYENFCEGETWPAGEYTLLYTIDGYEVNRLTITLE